MTRLQQYQQKADGYKAEMEAILVKADGDSEGILTAEQQTAYDGIKAKWQQAIQLRDDQAAQDAADRAAVSVQTARPDGTLAITAKPRAEADPRKGFHNHQEFILACIENAGLRDREQVSDERLRILAVSDAEDKRAAGELAFLLPVAFSPPGLNAAAGSDEQGVYDDRYGGFAVTPTFLPGMLQLGFEGDPTTGRTQTLPMQTPTVEILARTDKDHSSSVSGGLTVTRKPETVAASASRFEMEKVTLKATSLFGLSYATEELLQDSPISFAALIGSGFKDQFAHHMLNEKIRGLGGSEYQGVLKALDASSLGPTVSVAKETNQDAATIFAENVIKMRAQCWGYGNAIWIANHDCYPQLAVLSIAVGTGGTLIYQQSLIEGRPDMLQGRPIFYSEYPATLGSQGDLILGNWSQYLDGLYQPMQSAESIHVRFVNHERTFKFWLRNAGAPWWRTALTPTQSTTKLSPFVVLDARA